jgi:vacuolar-type H+-ATPase subunit H
MDILYLVDRLENLIAGSRRMPLVNQIMIKESDILNIVDQLRTTIPDEIKMARRIIQEKERILAQAQADASTLLARAQEESERAIKREGLLLAAGERSQEIVREAQEQAERLKDDADAYVGETLRSLRDHLASIEISVGRTILSIEKGLESLEPPLEEAPSPGEEDGMEDSYGEFEEPGEVPFPSRPVPRRATLAADTMGGPNYQHDIIPKQ